MSRLLAGMLLYGGLGWLLGFWLGNPPAFAAGGVLLGVALSLYITFVRLSAADQQSHAPRERRS